MQLLSLSRDVFPPPSLLLLFDTVSGCDQRTFLSFASEVELSAHMVCNRLQKSELLSSYSHRFSIAAPLRRYAVPVLATRSSFASLHFGVCYQDPLHAPMYMFRVLHSGLARSETEVMRVSVVGRSRQPTRPDSKGLEVRP